MFISTNKNLKYFFIFFIFFSFESFSGGHSHSEKEVAVALRVLEKALLLSPEYLNHSKSRSIVPFYKIGDHKIYLDEGFWDLTRIWLKIYIEEIEKHCSCDLDPDLMIQEAKNYLPQSFLKQKVLNLGKDLSYTTAYMAARYGYAGGALVLSVETAETLLFGILHFACEWSSLLALSFLRKIQKYARVFSYSGKAGASRVLSSAKMFWLSRQIKKSKKRVFFYIEQALVFREQELEKINREGPKGLFHKRGHRLLWIEQLKVKTDPLFEQIRMWEVQLQDGYLSLKEKDKISKKIKKARKKIEKISKVNRKDFFGRFRRFLLFLRSGKRQVTYMSGNRLPDKIVKRNVLWPLSLQEDVLERALVSDISERSNEQNTEIKPDKIRDGLIEEFLSKRPEAQEPLQGVKELRGRKQAIQDLLMDIDKIFDTEIPSSVRLIKASAVEAVLGSLFTLQSKVMSSSVLAKKLSEKHDMSYFENMEMQWIFGENVKLIDKFSDFLSFVAMTKDKTEIQFYKYESMEKLLAFLDYLYEVQNLLNKEAISLEKSVVFEKLAAQEHQIQTLSLLKGKKTTLSINPLRRKCEKLVEKYQ